MIEKLFTSKNRVKIMKFLFFDKRESYVREISNNLKIPVSAVKTEIDNLETIGIIKKLGRILKLNLECNFLEDLKNILIKTDYILYPLKEELKDKQIQFAILFGSFAKGNYSYESDVDLLVVGEIKQAEVFKKIRNVEKKIKRDINPVVWSTKEFINEKKQGKFFREIFANKFIILKGEENEFRKIVRG